MKGKTLRTVVTTREVRRRWHHPDPEDLKRLAAGELETKRAGALQAHLRGCLRCSLLAGRAEARQEVGAEG